MVAPAGAKSIRSLKNTIVALVPSLDFSLPEKRKLFDALTALGSTPQTDEFLKGNFLDLQDQRPMTSESFNWTEKLLEGNRIYGNEFRLALARKILSGEVRILSAQRPLEAGKIDQLIQRLNRLVPNNSLAKDQFLDELSWKLGITGKELAVFIDYLINPEHVQMPEQVQEEMRKIFRTEAIESPFHTPGRSLTPKLLSESLC